MLKTQHTLLNKSSCNLSEIENESVGLVVTSPPYPIIEMWDESFKTQLNKDNIPLLSDPYVYFEQLHKILDTVWNQMYRILIPGGIMCINIGDATKTIDNKFCLYSNHSRILTHCLSLGFDNLPNIIWRKQTNAPNKFMGSGMLPVGAYVTLQHEHILIFRKGSRRLFKTEAEKQLRRQSAFFWQQRNTWFSDLWQFKGIKQTINIKGRDRSGAFPFELPYRLINMFSIKGDTVIDPFVGTGSTIYTAMCSERNSIGVDIDKEYIEHIKSNITEITNTLNDYIEKRIMNHITFVDQYELNKNKLLTKFNKYHDVKVISSQETDIRINMVDNINKINDLQYQVQYKGGINV